MFPGVGLPAGWAKAGSQARSSVRARASLVRACCDYGVSGFSVCECSNALHRHGCVAVALRLLIMHTGLLGGAACATACVHPNHFCACAQVGMVCECGLGPPAVQGSHSHRPETACNRLASRSVHQLVTGPCVADLGAVFCAPMPAIGGARARACWLHMCLGKVLDYCHMWLFDEG